jgi:hypothetical protein
MALPEELACGFSTKELYTDEDEVLFNVQCPVLVNGIEEICTRGDLLDRSIVVELAAIPPASRLPERQFWQEFEGHWPAILGYLLDAVSAALSNQDRTNVPALPRMADFSQWVTAGELALGWTEGHFSRIYESNRQSSNEVTLDASPIAGLLMEVVRSTMGDWVGTAKQLLDELNGRATDGERQLRNWPRSPRAVSNAIRRLIPNLRTAGFHVDFAREGTRARKRLIILRELDEQCEGLWRVG